MWQLLKCNVVLQVVLVLCFNSISDIDSSVIDSSLRGTENNNEYHSTKILNTLPYINVLRETIFESNVLIKTIDQSEIHKTKASSIVGNNSKEKYNNATKTHVDSINQTTPNMLLTSPYTSSEISLGYRRKSPVRSVQSHIISTDNSTIPSTHIVFGTIATDLRKITPTPHLMPTPHLTTTPRLHTENNKLTSSKILQLNKITVAETSNKTILSSVFYSNRNISKYLFLQTIALKQTSSNADISTIKPTKTMFDTIFKENTKISYALSKENIKTSYALSTTSFDTASSKYNTVVSVAYNASQTPNSIRKIILKKVVNKTFVLLNSTHINCSNYIAGLPFLNDTLYNTTLLNMTLYNTTWLKNCTRDQVHKAIPWYEDPQTYMIGGASVVGLILLFILKCICNYCSKYSGEYLPPRFRLQRRKRGKEAWVLRQIDHMQIIADVEPPCKQN